MLPTEWQVPGPRGSLESPIAIKYSLIHSNFGLLCLDPLLRINDLAFGTSLRPRRLRLYAGLFSRSP